MRERPSEELGKQLRKASNTVWVNNGSRPAHWHGKQRGSASNRNRKTTLIGKQVYRANRFRGPAY